MKINWKDLSSLLFEYSICELIKDSIIQNVFIDEFKNDERVGSRMRLIRILFQSIIWKARITDKILETEN